jgi:hypothetical protein
MIVVGNPNTLQKDPNWYEFVKYCYENGACIGGNFVMQTIDYKMKIMLEPTILKSEMLNFETNKPQNIELYKPNPRTSIRNDSNILNVIRPSNFEWKIAESKPNPSSSIRNDLNILNEIGPSNFESKIADSKPNPRTSIRNDSNILNVIGPSNFESKIAERKPNPRTSIRNDASIEIFPSVSTPLFDISSAEHRRPQNYTNIIIPDDHNSNQNTKRNRKQPKLCCTIF